MSVLGRIAATTLWVGSALACVACSGAAPEPTSAHDAAAVVDAPLVAAQPGAWFDAQGNLTVVGPGRRLRLVLSAPVSACAPAFNAPGGRAEVAARASLPFHVLAEACRAQHPSILLAAESEGATPAELERSYHDVAHCAASELSLDDGWVPRFVAEGDACGASLGLGWRLPTPAELSGLTVDDRKAIAGALFDTEGRTTFGSLLLYARPAGGALTLATLSPNAAEQAPPLDETKLDKPLFGAALRCVRDGDQLRDVSASLPPMPHAGACLRELRAARGLAPAQVKTAMLPELQKLKAWIELAQRTPNLMRSEPHLRELSQLLAAPALDQLAREARQERELTERYAELAEGLDDPGASSGERERRRAEFDSLRKRLGGQIVGTAEASGAARTQLSALLQHLQLLLERQQTSSKPSPKRPTVDYAPLLTRVRELGGAGKATSP